jgi:hypothetical protein
VKMFLIGIKELGVSGFYGSGCREEVLLGVV